MVTPNLPNLPTRRPISDNGEGERMASYLCHHAELSLEDRRAGGEGVPGFASVHRDKERVHRFLSMPRWLWPTCSGRSARLRAVTPVSRSRCVCLLSGAALSVLDEPMIHRDIMSARVLEQAPRTPGRVFVVSHDRFFVEARRLLV